MLLMVLGAIIIGITLGLLGSGGSVLTMPVLVYLLDHDKDIAVAETMAIVGLIALAAVIPNVFCRNVNWRSVFFFGVPGMVGTFGGAWIGSHYFSGPVKLVFFAAVMLFAALMMFAKRNALEAAETGQESTVKNRHFRIAIEGTIVGIVTGIVGVGGGFLIVPALVVLGGLSIRIAVGTSLAVVALKCGVGFSEYQYEFMQVGLSVDWMTVFWFSIVGAAGSFVGQEIGKTLNQRLLHDVFAILLIVVSVLIIAKEIPAAFAAKEPMQTRHGIAGELPLAVSERTGSELAV
ncbi:MAG: sulfite exporter TauE/SafE family protein [Planctomycetota bacterium]|nr:sulfite exporter TauE/SafE family protein [Planctomycetota bacterium]